MRDSLLLILSRDLPSYQYNDMTSDPSDTFSKNIFLIFYFFLCQDLTKPLSTARCHSPSASILGQNKLECRVFMAALILVSKARSVAHEGLYSALLTNI
jgi:hypothetical protein